MASEKKSVVRAVRLDPLYDDIITAIAEYENRTISNTIQRLLILAIYELYDKNHNPGFQNFLDKKNHIEFIKKEGANIGDYSAYEIHFTPSYTDNQGGI